jgi:AraC-like DNA-binding protein/ligand-binding sensor protein
MDKNMSERTLAATVTAPVKETNPLLLRAWNILSIYAKATGAVVCILDQDFLPIREILPLVLGRMNTCVNYCRTYSGESGSIRRISDLRSSPCNMMHINAIKEAHHFGGSYIYMCELGFMFWTSPLYSNGRFSGALVGSGFIGIDPKETMDAMDAMSQGTVSREELAATLAPFSKGESERIKSLAELLLICAEYLSTGTDEDNDDIKWRIDQPFPPDMQTELLRNQKSKWDQRSPQNQGAYGTLVSAYPIDKERTLLAALRRGDHEAGRRILKELLGILFLSNANPGDYQTEDMRPFKFIQFRAIELVVLLSRAAMGPGVAAQRSSGSSADDATLETNNRYLRRIQEVKTIEELTDVLHIIVERMSAQIFSFQGVRHASALRKAERFIWENYTRKISLQEIAGAAGLSAPYFSTIFKEEMGENLSAYLNRLRVEKAGHMLTETDLTLSEIALSCGFEDQSWFSKIFKSYAGISPGKYRSQGGVDNETDLWSTGRRSEGYYG